MYDTEAGAFAILTEEERTSEWRSPETGLENEGGERDEPTGELEPEPAVELSPEERIINTIKEAFGYDDSASISVYQGPQQMDAMPSVSFDGEHIIENGVKVDFGQEMIEQWKVGMPFMHDWKEQRGNDEYQCFGVAVVEGGQVLWTNWEALMPREGAAELEEDDLVAKEAEDIFIGETFQPDGDETSESDFAVADDALEVYAVADEAIESAVEIGITVPISTVAEPSFIEAAPVALYEETITTPNVLYQDIAVPAERGSYSSHDAELALIDAKLFGTNPALDSVSEYTVLPMPISVPMPVDLPSVPTNTEVQPVSADFSRESSEVIPTDPISEVVSSEQTPSEVAVDISQTQETISEPIEPIDSPVSVDISEVQRTTIFIDSEVKGFSEEETVIQSPVSSEVVRPAGKIDTVTDTATAETPHDAYESAETVNERIAEPLQKLFSEPLIVEALLKDPLVITPNATRDEEEPAAATIVQDSLTDTRLDIHPETAVERVIDGSEMLQESQDPYVAQEPEVIFPKRIEGLAEFFDELGIPNSVQQETGTTIPLGAGTTLREQLPGIAQRKPHGQAANDNDDTELAGVSTSAHHAEPLRRGGIALRKFRR